MSTAEKRKADELIAAEPKAKRPETEADEARDNDLDSKPIEETVSSAGTTKSNNGGEEDAKPKKLSRAELFKKKAAEQTSKNDAKPSEKTEKPEIAPTDTAAQTKNKGGDDEDDEDDDEENEDDFSESDAEAYEEDSDDLALLSEPEIEVGSRRRRDVDYAKMFEELKAEGEELAEDDED